MIQCERLKSSQRWRSDDGTVLNKCQKPIAVMLNLIEMFLPKSGLIVDVTCGTGTTAVRSNLPFSLFRDIFSFTCFCYKCCFKYSFGSRGITLYLFHLFGIHVLSEFSFPLFPLLSSRRHIDSKISLSLVRGTCETLFFEISPL